MLDYRSVDPQSSGAKTIEPESLHQNHRQVQQHLTQVSFLLRGVWALFLLQVKMHALQVVFFQNTVNTTAFGWFAFENWK